MKYADMSAEQRAAHDTAKTSAQANKAAQDAAKAARNARTAARLADAPRGNSVPVLADKVQQIVDYLKERDGI